NPEGVSFIHKIKVLDDRQTWLVDGKYRVIFSETIPYNILSYYRKGDVSQKFFENLAYPPDSIYCNVGMATAAAIFSFKSDNKREVKIQIPLVKEQTRKEGITYSYATSKTEWPESLEGCCWLKVPDERIQFL